MSKTTTLHVHRVFLYTYLQSLHKYDVKWPNFKLENGKAINSNMSVRTRARSLLFSAKLNSLLLRNWTLWSNREKNWKDAKSIFQRRFHGRHPCRIVRSLKLSPRSPDEHCTVPQMIPRPQIIPKMDRKWSSTASDPQSRPQMIAKEK